MSFLNNWNKKGRRSLEFSLLPKFSVKLNVFTVLWMIICLFLFTTIRTGPDKFTVGALLVITFVSQQCLSSELASRLLKKYRTRGKTVLIAVIAVYASFASFGQRYFLDGNTRMHISMDGVFYLILGIIWFIPLLYTLLFGLEYLASSPREIRSDPVRRRQVFWTLLAILCFCQAVIAWNFWPGGFPADCIDQFQQALGIRHINNWHPAINSMLYRIVLSVYPRAGALIAVQLFVFALICTHFLMLGYDHGVSLEALIILGVVFSLMPNMVISGISPLKDYYYMLALLWETYLLVRLGIDPGELRRWKFCAALSLALFLTRVLRHNGIVPFAAVLLVFAWMALCHFSGVKLRLAAVSLSSILLVAIYQGPVFSLYGIERTTGMSPYTTMLCAVASCANKDLPLSDESIEIMESALPIDQWAEYYDRFSGHDTYYWGRGELANEYPFEPMRINSKDAFTVYLEALRKYPDVVIKDRLDGMDILWDVRRPPDSFNTKGFYGTVINADECERIGGFFDFGQMNPEVHYYNSSQLLKVYQSAMNTETNSIFDMLIWRSGAYLILLMILGVFWWTNRMNGLLLAAVPLLGNIAGLTLVLYHQSYRYVAAVQVLTLALAFCSVFLRNTGAGNWQQILTARESAEPPAKKAKVSSISFSQSAQNDTAQARMGEKPRLDRVAVLIPCYNESQSIAKVVRDISAALPEAVVYVYDNNSTDGTAELAREAGAVVRRECQQGKGNVVRRMFREIDAQCYLILDGDDTYPADAAPEMVRLVLEQGADMVVGDRLSSTYFQENTRPFHNFGNSLVRASINSLFHSNIQDIMTGYRAFSYQFVKTFPVLSAGFEIETEMTIHAVDKKMHMENVVVDYRDRSEGSESKLNTFTDGAKVLMTIARLFQNYRPLRFFGLLALLLAAVSTGLFIPILTTYIRTGLVPRFPTLIVSGFLMLAALMSLFGGLLLDNIRQKDYRDFEFELQRVHDQYVRWMNSL